MKISPDEDVKLRYVRLCRLTCSTSVFNQCSPSFLNPLQIQVPLELMWNMRYHSDQWDVNVSFMSMFLLHFPSSLLLCERGCGTWGCTSCIVTRRGKPKNISEIWVLILLRHCTNPRNYTPTYPSKHIHTQTKETPFFKIQIFMSLATWSRTQF